MKLVNIDSNTAVSPEAVASVVVKDGYYGRDSVVVRLLDGTEYMIQRDYNKSIWETHKRLVEALTKDD